MQRFSRIRQHPEAPLKCAGFTLVELSIALVIIGLLVAGLLVGQSLIRAAEIRRTLSQLDEFDKAVAVFRTKYLFLPGDIPGSKATGYGLPGDVTVGNGDGKIRNGSAAPDRHVWQGEVSWVWPQLDHEGTVTGGPYTNAVLGGAGNGLPDLGDGRNKALLTADYGNRNGYILGSFQFFGADFDIGGAPFPANQENEFNILPTLAAQLAYAIDVKRDDGIATQGRVTGRGIYAAWLNDILPPGTLTQDELDGFENKILTDRSAAALESVGLGDFIKVAIGFEDSLINHVCGFEDLQGNVTYNVANEESLCGVFIQINQ